jgi:hypothetical protein
MPPPRIGRVDEIRHPAHRLDSTGKSAFRFAEQDALRSRGNRLKARRTGLVDRVRGDTHRNAGAVTDLPRGIGAGAGLTRMAEDDFVYFVGGNLRALKGCSRGDGAKLGRVDLFERSAVSSDWRARSTQDDDGTRGHKRVILSNACSTQFARASQRARVQVGRCAGAVSCEGARCGCAAPVSSLNGASARTAAG